MTFHPQTSTPFLKWVGGKSRLLNQLLPLIPAGKRLIEPFVGAGSIFLASDCQSFVINDDNPDLVAIWVALKCRPEEYIRRASEFFVPANNNPQAYLRIREEFNRSVDRFERAVRLLYLNKHCFNGLFRVNRSGGFNVPFAYPIADVGFPFVQLEDAARKLDRCLVLGGGFPGAMELAREGDVVYCAPPYLDSISGKSFTAYTDKVFEFKEHQALVSHAKAAVLRGATVVISNHDTPESRELYAGFEIHTFDVTRTIASKPDSRRKAKELVAIIRP